jgi:hypothetical protein
VPLHGDIVGCGGDHCVSTPLFILVPLQRDIAGCSGDRLVSTPLFHFGASTRRIYWMQWYHCISAPSTIVLNGYVVIKVEMAY